MTDESTAPGRFAFLAAQRPDWAAAFGAFFGAAYRPATPALSTEQRVLTYLVVLTAAGAVDGFRTHLRDAQQAGLTREQIIEALLLVTPAFGYQKVLDVIDELRDYPSEG